MKGRQKVFLVSVTPGETAGLEALNHALGQGWRFVQAVPLGGAGALLSALVVLERAEAAMEDVMEQAHEEPEALLEELEGDGAQGEPPE